MARRDQARSGAVARRSVPAARLLALLIVAYAVLATAIVGVQQLLPTVSAAPTDAGQTGGLFPPPSPAASSGIVSAAGVLHAGTAMLEAMALAGPIAWVYLVTRRRKGFAQSIVHTILMLPPAVAGTMVLVQNSIPLAFSLAGLAVLRFRNTLDDTKDAIYLFVATSIGISAAARALDVGLALSFLFSTSVLILWWTDLGRTPRRIKAKLALTKLRETRESRIPAVAGQPPADPWNARLRVHASLADEAQAAVESVLRGTAKRWELAGVSPGAHGFQQLDYVVRLRPSAERGALLNEMRSKGAPHIVGAEFR